MTCRIATRSSMKAPCHEVVGFESRGDDSMGNHQIEVELWLCSAQGHASLNCAVHQAPSSAMMFAPSRGGFRFEARSTAAYLCCMPVSLDKITVRQSPKGSQASAAQRVPRGCMPWLSHSLVACRIGSISAALQAETVPNSLFDLL